MFLKKCYCFHFYHRMCSSSCNSLQGMYEPCHLSHLSHLFLQHKAHEAHCCVIYLVNIIFDSNICKHMCHMSEQCKQRTQFFWRCYLHRWKYFCNNCALLIGFPLGCAYLQFCFPSITVITCRVSVRLLNPLPGVSNNL